MFCSKQMKRAFLIRNYLLIVLLYLINNTSCFQFSPPSVTTNPLTINSISQYVISLDRSYTQDLIQTAWSTQLVPTNSKITLYFPSTYNLTQTIPILTSLIINDQVINNAKLSVLNASTLEILNAILADLAISYVTIGLINVMNPSPAITTTTFMAKIGVDTTSVKPSSNSVVTLLPDVFSSCKISFNPTYTNTTGSMILNLDPKNAIPVNGSIVITFPVSLQWSEDVSTSHPLPLDKVSNCTVVSTQITQVSCMGSISTHKVVVSFSTTKNITLFSNLITVTIPGLFSPPTISAPDLITVSSFTNLNYGLDLVSQTISELQPQVLSNFVIQPTVSPLFINTLTPLNFNFTNTDTISRSDYFQIVFPAATNISYTRSSSTLNLTNVTYNSSTLTMRFYQVLSSINTNIGTSINIKFVNYLSALTSKATQSIVLTVYSSNGNKKMVGSGLIQAQPRIYSITSTASTSLQINQISTYSLILNLQNTLSPNTLIRIILPMQLQLTNFSICPTVNTSTLVVSCEFSTSSSSNVVVSLKNIWVATPMLGQVRIDLFNIINPPFSILLPSFVVNIFYDQADLTTQVAIFNTSISTINIQPKILDTTKVLISLSNYSVFSKSVTYNISFQINSDVPTNGLIYFGLPTINSSLMTILTPGSGFKCVLTYQLIQYVKTCTFDLIKQSISVNLSLTSLISSNYIKLTFIDCCSNPFSTRPIDFQNIKTMTSLSHVIEQTTNTIQITGFKQILMNSVSVVRSSEKNNQINQWNVTFQQQQPIEETASKVFIIFDWIALNSNQTIYLSNIANVSNRVLVTNYLISNDNISIAIVIPTNLAPSSTYTVSLSSITNPSTFKIQKIKIQTFTSDLYSYSSIQNALNATSIPSLFLSQSHQFMPKVLGQFSSLSITLESSVIYNSQVTKLQISNLKQYMISNATLNQSITCQDILIYNCILSVDNNMLTVLLTNNNFFTNNPLIIQLNNLYINPFNTTFINISVTSYSLTYAASITNAINFGTMCTMPCKQCLSLNQSSSCTSCFTDPKIAKQKYLYNQTCYSVCPTSTFETSNLTLPYIYICQRCSIQCLTCVTTSLTCLSCNTSSLLKYYYNSSCISSCANTTYLNETIKTFLKCDLCISPCMTCISSVLCTSCVTNYYLFQNNCLLKCPINITVANITTQICDLCKIQCLICVNTTSTCLSCAFNNQTNHTYLYVQQSNSCVTVCPLDKVIDSTDTQCVNCLAPCKTCQVIQTNCTSCINGSFLSLLNINRCLKNCQSLYFGNSTSWSCQICTSSTFIINCKNCSSQNTCNQCDKNSGYVFFPLNKTCLNKVPSGYVNISGVAQLCTSTCLQCILTIDKCTKCYTQNYLFNSTCLSQCPTGYVGVVDKCLICDPSCKQCEITQKNCISCFMSYKFMNHTKYFSNSYYIGNAINYNECLINCPSGFYPSSLNIILQGKTCESCKSPCLTCTNLTFCQSCMNNKYLFQGNCFDICPNGSIYELSNPINQCLACVQPCLLCQNQTFNCMSCITGYSYFPTNNRCYLKGKCPANISIQNIALQTCQSCVSPCLKCQTTVSKCLSCVQNNYYIAINNSCGLDCPSGYYKGVGVCIKCISPCIACFNSSSCITCISPYYFYQNSCVQTCPVKASIISNQSCTSCQSQCINCSSSNYCYQCQPSSILYLGNCLTTCPVTNLNSQKLIFYYNISDNSKKCLTAAQIAQTKLKESLLSVTSILPLPFFIIATVLILAGIMSKIQSTTTYFVGWAYVVFGVAEMASLLYQTILYQRKLESQTFNITPQQQFLLYLMYGSLGLIGMLNFFSLTCGSYFLSQDLQFKKWINSKKQNILQTKKVVSNIFDQHEQYQAQTAQQNQIQNQTSMDMICCQPSTSFILTTFLSFVLTYKLKLIIFTRLFNFTYLNAKLQSIQQFRFFNFISFVGFLHQALIIYVAYRLFVLNQTKDHYDFLLAVVDCLVCTVVGVVLAVASTHKDQDFFVQQSQHHQKHKQLNDKQLNHDKYAEQSKRALFKTKNSKFTSNINKIANLHNLTSPRQVTSVNKILQKSNQKDLLRSKNFKNVKSKQNKNKKQNSSNQSIDILIDKQIEQIELKKQKIEQVNHNIMKATKQNKIKPSKLLMKNKIPNEKVQIKYQNQQQYRSPVKNSSKSILKNQSKPKLTNNNSSNSKLWTPIVHQLKMSRNQLSRKDMIDLFNPLVDLSKQDQIQFIPLQTVLKSSRQNIPIKQQQNIKLIKQQQKIKVIKQVTQKIQQQDQEFQIKIRGQGTAKQLNNNTPNQLNKNIAKQLILKSSQFSRILPSPLIQQYPSSNQIIKISELSLQNGRIDSNSDQNNHQNQLQQSIQRVLPFIHDQLERQFKQLPIKSKINKPEKNIFQKHQESQDQEINQMDQELIQLRNQQKQILSWQTHQYNQLKQYQKIKQDHINQKLNQSNHKSIHISNPSNNRQNYMNNRLINKSKHTNNRSNNKNEEQKQSNQIQNYLDEKLNKSNQMQNQSNQIQNQSNQIQNHVNEKQNRVNEKQNQSNYKQNQPQSKQYYADQIQQSKENQGNYSNKDQNKQKNDSIDDIGQQNKQNDINNQISIEDTQKINQLPNKKQQFISSEQIKQKPNKKSSINYSIIQSEKQSSINYQQQNNSDQSNLQMLQEQQMEIQVFGEDQIRRSYLDHNELNIQNTHQQKRQTKQIQQQIQQKLIYHPVKVYKHNQIKNQQIDESQISTSSVNINKLIQSKIQQLNKMKGNDDKSILLQQKKSIKNKKQPRVKQSILSTKNIKKQQQQKALNNINSFYSQQYDIKEEKQPNKINQSIKITNKQQLIKQQNQQEKKDSEIQKKQLAQSNPNQKQLIQQLSSHIDKQKDQMIINQNNKKSNQSIQDQQVPIQQQFKQFQQIIVQGQNKKIVQGQNKNQQENIIVENQQYQEQVLSLQQNDNQYNQIIKQSSKKQQIMLPQISANKQQKFDQNQNLLQIQQIYQKVQETRQSQIQEKAQSIQNEINEKKQEKNINNKRKVQIENVGVQQNIIIDDIKKHQSLIDNFNSTQKLKKLISQEQLKKNRLIKVQTIQKSNDDLDQLQNQFQLRQNLKLNQSQMDLILQEPKILINKRHNINQPLQMIRKDPINNQQKSNTKNYSISSDDNIIDDKKRQQRFGRQKKRKSYKIQSEKMKHSISAINVNKSKDNINQQVNLVISSDKNPRSKSNLELLKKVNTKKLQKYLFQNQVDKKNTNLPHFDSQFQLQQWKKQIKDKQRNFTNLYGQYQKNQSPQHPRLKREQINKEKNINIQNYQFDEEESSYNTLQQQIKQQNSSQNISIQVYNTLQRYQNNNLMQKLMPNPHLANNNNKSNNRSKSKNSNQKNNKNEVISKQKKSQQKKNSVNSSQNKKSINQNSSQKVPSIHQIYNPSIKNKRPK